MKPEEFVIWLDGFLEGRYDSITLKEKEVNIIKTRLSSVFNKITPTLPNVLNPPAPFNNEPKYCGFPNLPIENVELDCLNTEPSICSNLTTEFNQLYPVNAIPAVDHVRTC